MRDSQGNVLSIYDKGAYFRYTNTGTVANPIWNTPTQIPGANIAVRGTAAGLAKNPVEILPPLPHLPLALSEQIIYGSARIGAYKPQRNQKLPATDPNRGKIMPILVGQLTLGYKSYELSNHLGNVLTTISDNKMMVQASGLVYLQAVVLTTQDYYPFGKGMSERSYVNVDRNAQRYGFNGKENDEEWGKTIQDYGFRIYNPELCKFASVDPLSREFPWNSPYAFAENTPIENLDLDGEEIYNYRLKTVEYNGSTIFKVEGVGIDDDFITQITLLNMYQQHYIHQFEYNGATVTLARVSQFAGLTPQNFQEIAGHQKRQILEAIIIAGALDAAMNAGDAYVSAKINRNGRGTSGGGALKLRLDQGQKIATGNKPQAGNKTNKSNINPAKSNISDKWSPRSGNPGDIFEATIANHIERMLPNKISSVGQEIHSIATRNRISDIDINYNQKVWIEVKSGQKLDMKQITKQVAAAKQNGMEYVYYSENLGRSQRATIKENFGSDVTIIENKTDLINHLQTK